MKKDNATGKRILNTKEAAEYLGIVSPRSLEKWRTMSQPKGPDWVNLEGKIGYRVEDLDRYLKKGVREPGDDFAA